MSTEAPARTEMTMTNYRSYHAKKAGERAIGIKNNGRKMVDDVLADNTGRFSLVDQARARVNGFALISGTSGEGQNIAIASTGVFLGANDNQKETYAEVLGAVMSQGMEARMKRYGEKGDKFLIFVEGDYSPREMLQRLVHAPDQVYQMQQNLHAGFHELQAKRSEELLGGERGQLFEDIFYGKANPLVSPLLKGKESLVFGALNEGTDLISLNPDLKEQTWASLRVDTPDEKDGGGTAEMLEDEEIFLKGAKGKHRFVIKVSRAPDVECCITSMNELHFINNFVKDTDTADTSFNAIPFVYGDTVGAIYNNGKNYEIYHKNDFCNKCSVRKSNEGGCQCARES